MARAGGSLRLQPAGWQDQKMPDHAPTPPSDPPSDQVATQQRLRAEVHASVDAVAAEWQRLADATGAAPFLRPGWFAAWWAAFGAGRPEILALRRPDGALAALIALHRRLGRVLSSTNWHSPLYGMVVADQEAAAALAATLFERRPFEVSLGFVDAAAPELDLYRAAAAAAGYRMLERTMQRSPYVVTTGTWDDFARQRLSRNRRSQLGRARRRLEREGRVELELADGRERLDEVLEEAFRIEASGWKGTNGTAITSRPDTRRFYRDVARWAAGEGWLRIAFLRLDGRAVAMMYLLETDRTLWYLKGGYDPGFEHHSPGMVLLASVIEDAFGRDLDRIELLGGDERYKLAFTGDVHDRLRFQAFASSAPGLLSFGAFSYGRPAARGALTVARRIAGRSPNR
jgi:CelD/BcsL family acetyltransferase involved in cellulose biosynthesis